MHPPHSSYVTFEPPDIVHCHLIGHVEESDMLRIYEAQVEFAKDKPYLLVMSDVTRFGSMTPAARRAATRGADPANKVLPVRGSVIIGASFHVRVLGILITTAAKAISGTKDMELHFCNTEAQARAWVDKRRRELSGPK